jgi:RNA polymerase sigma-70 factor (ECF subfamily)
VSETNTTAMSDLEQLYREHAEPLWRAVYAYAGDPVIADDAVSEAFTQALRRGDGLRAPRAWLWHVAFRVAAGELKDGQRRASLEDRPVEVEEAPVDLIRALLRLSPKQRGALILHHYAGHPAKDVARILGSTEGAVRVHLSLGRRRLRVLLEEGADHE